MLAHPEDFQPVLVGESDLLQEIAQTLRHLSRIGAGRYVGEAGEAEFHEATTIGSAVAAWEWRHFRERLAQVPRLTSGDDGSNRAISWPRLVMASVSPSLTRFR